MTTQVRVDRARLHHALLGATAGFLRESGVRGLEWDKLPRWAAPALIVGSGALYGAVMASYNGLAGDRVLMVAYGAAKVPLLFVATMLLAVPSFYVLNLLLGVGDHFRRVWRALVDFQLAVSLQLAALVPVTAFMNLTNGDYRVAQAFSTLLFAGATWNARRALARAYAPLIAENPVHRGLLRACHQAFQQLAAEGQHAPSRPFHLGVLAQRLFELALLQLPVLSAVQQEELLQDPLALRRRRSSRRFCTA